MQVCHRRKDFSSNSLLRMFGGCRGILLVKSIRHEFPSGRSRRSAGRRYRRISVFRQKTPHGKETQTQRRKSDESYGRSSRQRVLHDEIVPKTRCAESGGFIFCSRMHIFLVSMMSALIAADPAEYGEYCQDLRRYRCAAALGWPLGVFSR